MMTCKIIQTLDVQFSKLSPQCSPRFCSGNCKKQKNGVLFSHSFDVNNTSKNHSIKLHRRKLLRLGAAATYCGRNAKNILENDGQSVIV